MCKYCSLEHHSDVIVRADIEQGTEEWHKIRSFSCGGTGAYDVIRNGFHPNNLKESKLGGFCSYAMQRGHDLEPGARHLFASLKKDEFEVIEVGAIQNIKWPHCHASPDGVLIKDNKIIGTCEIKCFLEKHHREILKNGIEMGIKAQLLWNLWLSETEVGYFIAYNPDMEDPKDRLYIEKVVMDERYKNKYEQEVRKGLDKIKNQ